MNKYFEFWGLLILFLTSFFLGALLLKTHLWTGIALVSLGICGVIWDSIFLLSLEDKEFEEIFEDNKKGVGKK